jgi:hypothetical protein
MFTLERPEAAKGGPKLRVKLLEQLNFRGRQIALRCRAHDCNHTNESLSSLEEEANAVRAFLRRHVSAIKARFDQAGSICKEVANPHEPLPWSRGDITLERLRGEKTIRHGSCPSHNHGQDWIGLKHQAYQAIWDRGGEQLLDGFPERTNVHGGVQAEQSLFE